MSNQYQVIAKPRKKILLGGEDKGLEKLDLIEIQRQSWSNFLEKSLKEIIAEFFPIDDYTGKKLTLYLNDLYFGEPRYSLDLCLRKKTNLRCPSLFKTNSS